jgi:hypothetical protein
MKSIRDTIAQRIHTLQKSYSFAIKYWITTLQDGGIYSPVD